MALIASAQDTLSKAQAYGKVSIIESAQLTVDLLGLPDWVPEPGTIASISLNTFADVDPQNDPAVNPNYPNSAPWRLVQGLAGAFLWSGCVYAEFFGTLGSVLFHGGGHSAYAGNEVYRHDVASRLVSRLTDPDWPLHRIAGDPTKGWYADLNQNGEHWSDATFTTTRQDQPGSTHIYDMQVYLPPGVGGAGVNGALLTVTRTSMAPVGSNNGRRAHILDLAGPTYTWARYSTNLAAAPTGGQACIAVPRNKVYEAGAILSPGKVNVLDLSTREFSQLTLTGSLSQHYVANLQYSEALDLLIYWQPVTPQLKVIDPDTGQVFSPGFTGPRPTTFGGGEWVEDHGRFYYYIGSGTTVHILTPSQFPTTQPWVWTTETLTGNPVSQAGNEEHCHRFLWAKPLRSFIWVPRHNTPVQAWRP